MKTMMLKVHLIPDIRQIRTDCRITGVSVLYPLSSIDRPPRDGPPIKHAMRIETDHENALVQPANPLSLDRIEVFQETRP